MKRFLRTTLCIAALISCTAMAAGTETTTTSTTTTTTAAPAMAGGPVAMQAKMFTHDQLATALQGVVDKINACDGNPTCLKEVKAWNEAAMDSVKKLAVNFPAGQKLSLELLCGNKPQQKSAQNVTTDAKSLFVLAAPAGQQCLVKGLEPKCGAIERNVQYPKLVTGGTLYCVTGDDTKLKQTTANLKEAVMTSMKKAMKNSMEQKPATAPAASS